MSLESAINYQLNKHPGIKKGVKRLYQRTMYTISPKIKSEGDITCISPNDTNHEYFFGYYDKSPWDITDRYILCMRANNTWSDVSPKDKADILLIDTDLPENDKDRVRKIAETSSWNVQQACMLQWLGPDFSSRILFNDYRDGKYVAIIKEMESGAERVIDAPVYTVSADGKTALTLDFSRLYNLRPGYGYYNVPEKTKGIALPDSTAVWKIDLESGEITDLLSYKDFASFQPRPEMQEEGSVHKVNHLMLSPSGNRCMVLYRWFVGQRKYTRLVTFNTDGSDMYVLSDDDMVSHCFWKDDEHILAFENKKDGGPGYYFMTDKTQNYERYWEQISNDGHPSYSPNRNMMVIDSYPNRQRIANIKVLNERIYFDVAKVFAPFKYDNDTRCDLHPRWNHRGTEICFDSVHEGHRGLYKVSISEKEIELLGNYNTHKNIKNEEKKTKVCFVLTACKRTGPVQQLIDNLVNLDKDAFELFVITLYPEDPYESRLLEISKFANHYFVPIGKKSILLGKTISLSRVIEKIQPDVIHTMGLFPDYAISRLKKYKQLITIHCFIFEDYPSRFGQLKGKVMEKIHLSAIKHSTEVVTCSNSLAEKYKDKLGISFKAIQNGVDNSKFVPISLERKCELRTKMGISEHAFVFVFSGKLSKIKNQEFLLDAFHKANFSNNIVLYLLGDGPEKERLQRDYSNYSNVIFTGNVSNVIDYLHIADVYVSPSTTEGMPYGVLEAMSTGLPVILSDIPQHKEVLQYGEEAGFIYEQGNIDDLISKMRMISQEELSERKILSSQIVNCHLSASIMSKRYGEVYHELANKS